MTCQLVGGTREVVLEGGAEPGDDHVPVHGDDPLGGGTRLYEALRGGRFVLVGDADVAGWADRVVVAAPAEPTGLALLVRPDGYVGWAGTDLTQLHRVLAGLAGAPATSDIG